MNQEQFDQAVETRMQSQWTATPVFFDNTKSTPPDNAPWVRMVNLTGQSQKIDLLNRYRTVGIIDFQVMVPLLSGVRAGKQLADQIASLWRSVTVSGIVFKTPSVARVGDTGNGWFQMNVSVPYYWDESF